MIRLVNFVSLAKIAPVGPIAATLVYLIVVFLGGALIAPILYWTVNSLAANVPILQGLAGAPFHRYVNRSLIFLAVIGLWPFLKSLGFKGVAQLGFRGHRPGSLIALGLLLALGTVVILAAAGFFGHARMWSPGTLRWSKFITNTIFASVAVALLEEVLFRGGFFNSLRSKHSFWPAALISSSIYAIVHFFAKPHNPEIIEWYSGFSILLQMCAGFTEWQMLIPSFINLLIIGLILCTALENSGSIYLSLGLHAGFIFGAKSFDFLTEPAPLGRPWMWGTDKLVDGWAATAILLLLWGYVHKRTPRHA